MASIIWDPKAREFLKKLPKEDAKRIFNKVDAEIKVNPKRFIESLVNCDFKKIRIGDYRLFVDYYEKSDELYIRAIRHRRDAYKR